MANRADIFDFYDYKKYLKAWLNSNPGKGRGLKSALAKELQCQTAYISHVFNTGAHFSLEHAHSLSKFIGHDEEESFYFHLLVQYARASTSALKEFLKLQLNKALEKRFVLKDRLQVKRTLSFEDQLIYYSSWHYGAIHVLVSIPEFQTPQALSKRLGLSVKKIENALSFLTATELVVKEAGKYRTGVMQLHLPHDSPLISKHHTNWRMKAIAALDRDPQEIQGDLHYSSVAIVSKEDVMELKSLLVKTIEKFREKVRASGTESAHCFTLDFFEL